MIQLVKHRIKAFWSSSILSWILTAINILLIGCYLLLDNNVFSYLFRGNPTSTKADLLSIYLGVIGGIGVFYGFYINNKKLEEQNKQNRIAEENRNDKRFTDAISFLRDNDPGVVLSGVNTLFQIAKQDMYYRQTVAILFGDFLSIKQTRIRDRRIDETVMNHLFFSDVFRTEHLELNDIDFSILPLSSKPISGFESLSFNNCRYPMLKTEDVTKIDIINTSIDSLFITNSLNVRIDSSILNSMGVIKSNVKFNNIIVFNNTLNHLIIEANKGAKEISIMMNEIGGSVDVKSFIVNKKAIDKNNGTVKQIQFKK